MRLFANAKYDFLSRRKIAYLITVALTIPGLLVVLFRGLNYSVEFTGGTLMQVESQEAGRRRCGAKRFGGTRHRGRGDPDVRV